MDLKVLKHIYEKMIDEKIEWLTANTKHCLERQYIISILENSVNVYYPEDKNHDKQ